MYYLIGFMVVSAAFIGVLVAGIAYYLHRKGLDKAALNAVKQDVTQAINK